MDQLSLFKSCRKCFAELPISSFGRASRAADGLSSWCRACHSASARQWSRDNRERANANKAAYLAAHPAAVQRRQESGAAYRSARRDAACAASKVWRSSNQDRQRLQAHLKRARKSNSVVVPVSAADIALRMSMFGDRCWMCGRPADQVDHVKPLARGGPHMLANLRPACGSCNNKKKAAWPVDTRIHRRE